MYYQDPAELHGMMICITGTGTSTVYYYQAAKLAPYSALLAPARSNDSLAKADQNIQTASYR